MEEGIPFVIKNKQVYLPFIGLLLLNTNERDIAPVHLISYMKPVLRNPIISRYELQEDIGLEKKAGISALSEYSLLSDNEYPTYAVTKKEVSGTGIKKMKQIHPGEETGCVVLELGYFIDFENKAVEDPMSVALSLTKTEMLDERVKMSVNEMLEEYVW